MRALKHLLLFVASGVSACVFVACSAVDRGAPPNTALEAVASYTTVVQPILASRCVACHGETKPKGRLRLDTPEGIVAGGVSGYTVVAGRSDESELVRRLHLPGEDEEHMPPGDKEPLSPQQVAALAAWIDAGAPFEGHVVQLEPFLAAQAPEPTDVAPIAPASDAGIAALREALVHVEPVAPGSNGLLVDVSAVAVKVDDALARELLGPVRASVVDLSLARAAIGDATLALLADMPHLTRLDLRGTAVTSAGLVHLAQLAHLEELVVAQTALGGAGQDGAALDALLACPSLERVFLWKSGLDAAAIARLRSERPALHVDAGDTPAAAIVTAETAVAFTSDAPHPDAPAGAEPAGAPINTTCPVNGSPIDPRFTVVYEGRTIAFCCGTCRSEFAKNPERYVASLP
jgi:YHS domain-containing protein/mono/diheme cytochrome c family protein